VSDAANTDILELLLGDHEEFRSLFAELERTEPELREDLFHYTVARLASHEAAAEAVVHSTVRDDVPGGEQVTEARLEEEAAAERLLKDVTDLDPTSKEFTDALPRLRDEVLAHADREERDEFPKLREHVDAERRRSSGRPSARCATTGRHVPTQRHPRTPLSVPRWDRSPACSTAPVTPPGTHSVTPATGDGASRGPRPGDAGPSDHACADEVEGPG
jgi:hypothetical protein